MNNKEKYWLVKMAETENLVHKAPWRPSAFDRILAAGGGAGAGALLHRFFSDDPNEDPRLTDEERERRSEKRNWRTLGAGILGGTAGSIIPMAMDEGPDPNPVSLAEGELTEEEQAVKAKELKDGVVDAYKTEVEDAINPPEEDE